jgi:hypothetical protein
MEGPGYDHAEPAVLYLFFPISLLKITWGFYTVWGVIPRRGGSGKAEGFGAWGRLPPVLIGKVRCKSHNPLTIYDDFL